MTPGQYMEKSDKASQSMDFTWAGMMKSTRHSRYTLISAHNPKLGSKVMGK